MGSADFRLCCFCFPIVPSPTGHFSENWGFVSMAPLIGGNTFSILFGRDFDSHVPTTAPTSRSLIARWPVRSVVADLTSALVHARGGVEEPGKRLCLEGRICYVSTLRLTTAACFLALLLSFVAAWRDWRKYKGGKVVYERLSEGNDETIMGN